MRKRAGSSPVARTNQKSTPFGVFFCLDVVQDENLSNAARISAAREGLTERLYNFLPRGENANRVLLPAPIRRGTGLEQLKCSSPAFVKDVFPFSCNLNTPMI